MVEHHRSEIPIKRQCEILSVNRSSAYYKPVLKTVDDETIRIMNRIDEIHTKDPTYGYRKIADVLKKDCPINRKRVQRTDA